MSGKSHFVRQWNEAGRAPRAQDGDEISSHPPNPHWHHDPTQKRLVNELNVLLIKDWLFAADCDGICYYWSDPYLFTEWVDCFVVPPLIRAISNRVSRLNDQLAGRNIGQPTEIEKWEKGARIVREIAEANAIPVFSDFMEATSAVLGGRVISRGLSYRLRPWTRGIRG